MRDQPRHDQDGRAICDRCSQPMNGYSMSYFNTDWICNDCYVKERAHPDFVRAQIAEGAAVRSGNYNFRGVGKPRDL